MGGLSQLPSWPLDRDPWPESIGSALDKAKTVGGLALSQVLVGTQWGHSHTAPKSSSTQEIWRKDTSTSKEHAEHTAASLLPWLLLEMERQLSCPAELWIAHRSSGNGIFRSSTEIHFLSDPRWPTSSFLGSFVFQRDPSFSPLGTSSYHSEEAISLLWCIFCLNRVLTTWDWSAPGKWEL